MKLRTLTDDDRDQAWALSRLAFGGDPATPIPPLVPDAAAASVAVGAFDDTGRLVAKVVARDYLQWWGGRPVPMAGIAGVVVLPEVRGQGLLRPMMEQLLRDCPQPISVLFPTAAGIYRRLGWEIVGTLDDTPVPLAALPRAAGMLRAASETDGPELQRLYDERGVRSNGLLTRTGPCFSGGPAKALDCDVVTVVLEDGEITGYVSYDRGRGYRGGAELKLWDCIARTPTALRALLGSLGTWDSVAETVLWRGRTEDLGLQLAGRLPPPRAVQPWMLRVLDPVAAVAARGFAPALDVSARFAVHGVGYRLEVAGGRGALAPISPDGLPALSAQGLALLFAGVASGRLLSSGLLDRPVPGLEEAFAGPAPEILDYF